MIDCWVVGWLRVSEASLFVERQYIALSATQAPTKHNWLTRYQKVCSQCILSGIQKTRPPAPPLVLPHTIHAPLDQPGPPMAPGAAADPCGLLSLLCSPQARRIAPLACSAPPCLLGDKGGWVDVNSSHCHHTTISSLMKCGRLNLHDGTQQRHTGQQNSSTGCPMSRAPVQHRRKLGPNAAT
jgi:hypothetical protein